MGRILGTYRLGEQLTAPTVVVATPESWSKAISSTAINDRTSLQLLDFDLTFNESEMAWYTQWFDENQITGDENDLAIQSHVAPQADAPAATLHIEYDGNGNGNVDARSDPIDVNNEELVYDISGVPQGTEGFYRVRISNYGGFNDVTNINVGLIH